MVTLAVSLLAVGLATYSSRRPRACARRPSGRQSRARAAWALQCSPGASLRCHQLRRCRCPLTVPSGHPGAAAIADAIRALQEGPGALNALQHPQQHPLHHSLQNSPPRPAEHHTASAGGERRAAAERTPMRTPTLGAHAAPRPADYHPHPHHGVSASARSALRSDRSDLSATSALRSCYASPPVQPHATFSSLRSLSATAGALPPPQQQRQRGPQQVRRPAATVDPWNPFPAPTHQTNLRQPTTPSPPPTHTRRAGHAARRLNASVAAPPWPAAAAAAAARAAAAEPSVASCGPRVGPRSPPPASSPRAGRTRRRSATLFAMR